MNCMIMMITGTALTLMDSPGMLHLYEAHHALSHTCGPRHMGP